MDILSYLMGQNSAVKKGMKVEVVTELPATGETNVIYLVPKEDTEENNIFEEYLYIDDEWELIGTTDIDLSGYQPLLTAGENITIENNVISATGGSSANIDILKISDYYTTTVQWNNLYDAINQEKISLMLFDEEVTITGTGVNAASVTVPKGTFSTLRANAGSGVVTKTITMNLQIGVKNYTIFKSTFIGSNNINITESTPNFETITPDQFGYFNIKGRRQGIYILTNTGISYARWDDNSTRYATINPIGGYIFIIKDTNASPTNNTDYAILLNVENDYIAESALRYSTSGAGLNAVSYKIYNFLTPTGTQTITGVKTFNALPESSVVPTTANQLVNKSYVDAAVATAGGGIDIKYMEDYPNNFALNNTNSTAKTDYIYLSGLKKGVYVSKTYFNSRYTRNVNVMHTISSQTYITINNWARIFVLTEDIEETYAIDTYIGHIVGVSLRNNPIVAYSSELYGVSYRLKEAIGENLLTSSSSPYISGTWNFSTVPKLDGTLSISNDKMLTPKYYVDEAIATQVGNISTVLSSLTTVQGGNN